MMATTARPWRRILVPLGFCLAIYLLYWHSQGEPVHRIEAARTSTWAQQQKEHASAQQALFRDLHLDESQCEAAFPGLTKDIHDTVALGSFKTRLAPPESGLVQVRIKDGQLYIVHNGVSLPELNDARTAALHQLHRAMLTAPAPIPDTFISLTIEDQPFGASFTYSRPAYPAPVAALPHVDRAFLMPHFSFWAWAPKVIGSLPRAAAAIDALEAVMPFASKDPRAIWRGTTGFNSPHHPHLRLDLVAEAAGQPWADVEKLEWKKGRLGFDAATSGDAAVGSGLNTIDGKPIPIGGAGNAIMMEDFCRYKYLIHTEGVTYSGRFQFLQMCNSVVITSPIAWTQHITHLVRPLFTSDLALDLSNATRKEPWQPSEGETKAWPIHYSPDEANIVFVSADWSDLGATVRWLEEHPAVAEGIAGRQRELFVGKGYLSPAAEVCYWRALIKGWSQVAEFEGMEDWDEKTRAVPWETFVLGHG